MSKELSVSLPDQIEEQDLQKRLAISLIVNLGFEGAIHSCQANSWDGVLKWVIALRETGQGDSRPGRPSQVWRPRA